MSETRHHRTAEASPLIRLEAVGRIYDDGAVVALRDIDLSIYPGECVGILGHSGSGKSSLIHILGGCDTPTTGRVYWEGKLLTGPSDWTPLRGIKIGLVFQEFHLLPTLTAIENVEMALIGRGIQAAERRARSASLLYQVGLGGRLHHFPFAMSGGERQRVAIARSIANRPALLLADEPTGNLDSRNAEAIVDLLFEIQRTHGTALVLVTHDNDLAARCTRCIHIRDGSIVDSGTSPAAGARRGRSSPKQKW
jgi:putative ABC transport system ATP-binding protein